jgi:2-polyprenyl-3-methyl-5-hydroxy-6-metoxy-1,4-benzoquinol methylase
MIERGGKIEERLYLHDLIFKHKMDDVRVRKTDMPNMPELIKRHKARYMLPGFFCRQGMKVLDFPCGSGYGYEILGDGVIYEGRDIDPYTIMYARKIYNNSEKVFLEDDLANPHLKPNEYDIIACIEGIEHIDKESQIKAIESFHKALKVGGKLILSTPIKKGETKNKYHKHELTENEFLDIIVKYFDDYEILEIEESNHNGETQNFMYVICKRGK